MTTTAAGDLILAWQTPILVGQLAGEYRFNSQLRELILTERDRRAHLGVGTVHAAKTSPDLLRLEHPLIETLRQLILDVAEALNEKTRVNDAMSRRPVEMIAEAWAVIYDSRGYHKIHSHHDSAWSGVYYVHTGAMASGSGLLELVDPRPTAAAAEPDRVPVLPISPTPGLIVAFPSWVQHWVSPYDGDDQRICVAFNVGFKR